MEKTCPQHGKFEIKIAKYAWYYKGLDSYTDNLFGENFYKKNNPTKIYTTSITSRCNLNCPICFADNQQLESEDITINFFKDQLKKIKNRGLGVHFSGGEPTMKEDLPELIKEVRESGNKSAIFTNGVKIAQDLEYLKLLKKCGLSTIYLWMDTIKNPEIYKKMRGKDFTDLKMKVIENVKKINLPLRILAVVAKGINESEINDLMEFAKKEEIINFLFFRGYNYLGKCGFSSNQEFLIDELVESVANQSRNLFTLEDIYYSQKLFLSLKAIVGKAPSCRQCAVVFIPKKKEKLLHHIFRFDKFSIVLDEFEKIWQEDQKRARKYLLLKCLSRLLTAPDLYYLYRTLKKTKAGSCDPPPFKNYYTLLINTINNVATFDIENIQRDCNDRSFNLGVKNNIPRCYELLDLYNKTPLI